MLRLSKTRSYSVPIILRALDIFELLSDSKTPLKTNEIADALRIARSTTYRILRTFVERGYIYQNLDSRFGVKDSKLRNIVPITRGPGSTSLNLALESDSNLSTDYVIEILLAVLDGSRRSSAGQLKQKDLGGDDVMTL